MMAGYRQFHGFSRAAFGKDIDLTSLLVYPQLQELSEELGELVEEGGIGMLTGEKGIGKTTALRHYLGGLRENSCRIAYQGSSRHANAILEGLIESLGAEPARMRATLLRQLSRIVARSYYEERKKTLVVVDDAHLLEDNFLEDLRLLTNFEMDACDPMILLLLGHPSLRLRLGRPVHLALLDRIRMQYRLEGLSREETAQYVDCHMKYAGGKGDVFSNDARDAIYEHAQGIPRRINALALACLKKSASRKVRPIDGNFVSMVVSVLQKD